MNHQVCVGGVPQPFTCSNRGYETDIHKGQTHGQADPPRAAGSVFADALIDTGDYSVWLEHVIEKSTNTKCYWLMWYKADGTPAITVSAAFGKPELRQMLSRFADLVP